MSKSFEQRVAEAMAGVARVSPREASRLREIYPDTQFVDPRSADDIAATTGMIPGALNVTLDQLGRDDGTLPPALQSRNRPVVAACEGGPMGALAAYALKQRGYRNVAFIDGGTRGWLDAGYATTR